MEYTGAEIVVKCLQEERVKHVFGYPGGAVLYIYNDQSCPNGWTKQEINVAIWGGAPVDACWTDQACMVMYIYDGQSCPSGWDLQNISVHIINGTTTPVDACIKYFD